MVTASKEPAGKGEPEAVADEEVAGLFGARLLQHGQAEIGADHAFRKGAVPLQGEEDVAAAGGEVEDACGALRGHGVDEPPAPVGIEAAAHGEIHEVVTGRNPAEHGGDGFGRLVREILPDGGVVGGAGRRHGSYHRAGGDLSPA